MAAISGTKRRCVRIPATSANGTAARGCRSAPGSVRSSMVSVRAAVGALLLVSCAYTHAADYPQRPIRLIVPFAAGGGLEFTARSIGQKLTEKHGHSIVID